MNQRALLPYFGMRGWHEIVALSAPSHDIRTAVSSAPRRLLVLATYPVLGAATRYRAVSYFEPLARAGIECDLVSYYNDEEFGMLYGAGLLQNARNTLRGALRLVQVGRRVSHYDGVFVQREAAPLGPPLLEVLMHDHWELPLIFDFDDAIWLPQHHKSSYPRLARVLRPEKSVALMRRASLVIAGSHALATKAREVNPHVEVLPTTVPESVWTPRPDRPLGALSDLPVVGWVGTHSTAAQLEVALRALERLNSAGRRFRLRVVGAGSGLPATSLNVECLPWSMTNEVEQFRAIDIGLAPMFDDAWSAGKCGFKQVQYLATGVPMVSSAVGGAQEILTAEHDALFAGSVDDWVRQLDRLLTDPSLRSRLAANGLAKFRSKLALEVQSERLVNSIRRVIGPRAGA